jgi:hypothetical protein
VWIRVFEEISEMHGSSDDTVIFKTVLSKWMFDGQDVFLVGSLCMSRFSEITKGG